MAPLVLAAAETFGVGPPRARTCERASAAVIGRATSFARQVRRAPADIGDVNPRDLLPERVSIADAFERIAAEAAASEARGAHSADGLRTSVAVIFTHVSIADEDHAFFAPLVAGLRVAALERQCDVMLCAPSRSHWLEEDAVARVVSCGCDAIIVLGGSDGNPDVLSDRFSGLPTVFVEYDTVGTRSAHISIDNERAFGDIVLHLATDAGRSRIATICGPLDMRVSAERLAAYRATMSRFGYPSRPEYIESGPFHLPEAGYDAMKRLLALDDPPDAVAAASDVQALGALYALEEAGLNCPEDVAITGFDDAAWAASLRPALTTVRQPAAQMGAAAVDAALRMVADPELAPPAVELHGELVVRESCGARVRARV